MLEMNINQGFGLQSLALQSGPRVIAMANHGDSQGELPLLWSLCSSLVGLGYGVGVLDGTSVESIENPGLIQLLDECHWSACESGDTLPWTVLPAALGLKSLCSQRPKKASTLVPLSSLMQNFGVIVIYASAEILSELLPDSGIEPLLTVSSVKMSCVTAYKALKQLLLNAKLRPTMASFISGSRSTRIKADNSPIRNLQACAMTYLGYRLDALTVQELAPGGRPSDDVRRLALRLLENALPLRRNRFLGGN